MTKIRDARSHEATSVRTYKGTVASTVKAIYAGRSIHEEIIWFQHVETHVVR